MIIAQHEIAFIDRNVDDVAALLAGLRSEVEPIVLSADAPAPRQMAEVLKHRSDLAAIHLIAHGAPGQVSCGSTALALETIESDSNDLAIVGRALGEGGSLQLWACGAARGERGAAFVDALARATGVEILAATSLVGAVALGGSWELQGHPAAGEARAPLTAHGMAAYEAVMATKTWMGTGSGTVNDPSNGSWSTSGNWSPSGAPVAGDDVVIGGTSGGSYTVTLDVVSATLNSLSMSFSGNTATLSIATGKALNVTNTVSLTGTNGITMTGGTINAGALTLTGGSTNVTGLGTLNISGHVTGTGKLMATGGTLDVFGTVDSGVVLSLGTSANSTLKLEGTATSLAAIVLSDPDQKLEIGANGNLTINALQNVTNGAKIQLDGGTLTDTAGLSIATGSTLTGSGTVAASILAGTGTVTASGGVLNLAQTVVASGGPAFTIATGSASTLKFSGTATTAAILINNANQTLEIGATGSLTIAGAEIITAGTIQLDGGTLNATGLTIGSGAKLIGSGTVAANIATGSGTITASGGQLNLTGTVASGNLFTIATASASTLKFSGTATAAAAISISDTNQTLEIGAGGNLTIGAAESISNGKIVLSGGTLSDAAGVTIGSNATLSGTGTAGAITLAAGTITQTGGALVLASVTGNGSVNGTITNAAITAKGGTLDLFGSIAGTSTLAIDSSVAATLKIDGTISSGAIAIGNANQTLEIGASGSLTLTAAESITSGKIQLDGGTLTDAAGLTIGVGATLIGMGTVAGSVNGTGTITASGGTLAFTGDVDTASATSFHIANIVGSVLKFSGAVGSASIHPTIAFDGGQGVLDLSSDTLPNFHATIANFAGGEAIKVNGAAAAVLDSSGTFITVYDAVHSSLGTINLSTSYAGKEFTVTSGTISVNADLTVPTGGTPDLIDVSDSGSSHTDNTTNVTAPAFTVALNGTVAVGDTVQLLLGGSPLTHAVTKVISFADLSAGSVTLTVTADDLGTDGIKSISAKFTDLAGNTSTTSALAITLDTTIATPTVALAHDTGSSNSDHITSDASLTVSAAAADVARVYTVDGGTASATYVAPTVDGAHTVVVTDTDTAGNTISTSIGFTLDNSIATPTVVLAHDTGSSNSDHITSDASLTVSAAAADVTRTYAIDGGSAAASYTAPTADGAHTVVVTDTDTAGNTISTSIDFTLDNSIDTPTVALTHDTGSSNSDHITSDASLTVSAAAADVTRTYAIDGGTAATSYTAPTADGAHTVVVTDTDTAGNTISTSIDFTLDNSIDTPTVVLTHDTGGSNSDHITSDASLTVSAAAADVTRTYAIDGGSAAASYTAPTADGAHTVVVTDTDTAGNTISTSIDFTLDNSIDTPTVVLTHDTGSSNSDHITQDGSLIVSAAAADVTRVYTVDGGTAATSYTAPIGDGAHTVVVTDTDTAGNTISTNIDFTLDNSIDTPTVVLAHDTGSSNSDHITKDASLTVSAAAADVTRVYTVDGTDSAGYTAPTADGAHTVVVTDTDTAGNTISTSIDFTLDNSIDTPTVVLAHDTGSSNSDHITSDASLTVSAAAADVTRVYTADGTDSAGYVAPIADGAHTVVVTDTDTAGNTISTSIDFTLDNSIDTPTVVLAHDTGSSNSDHITSDASLTVSAAAADVTRVYTVDGTDSAGYVAPIGDGAHTVVVTDTDTAGNTISTSIDFTLDNSIDTPTVVLAHDTGSSNSDHITSDASLTVSAAAADVTRVYTVDGTDSAGYVAPIGDGAHTVVVTDTDTAGNTISTSIDFTLDNSIATPTVVLAHDTGSSNSDHITSDASLTVSAAAADVTRTYAIDGGTAAASYTAPIGDGAHTVVVTDTDTAGNTISTSIDFTLDNSIATPTVVLAHDTGSSNSDHITSDASLTVSAAAADVTRTYAIDGGSAAASYTAPTADGAHTVVVTDTDTAGNTISTSIDFTLDNSIDTPTVALTHDTGSSNSDHITSDASLTVSAAAADVTRTYAIDGGTAATSYTAPTADGAHTVVVTDTDTAGNTISTSIDFTLDNSIDTPTVVLTHDTGGSNSDHITSDASLTVSAAAADVTRTYAIDGGSAAASYTAPTADGAHTVVVTDTDTAGNTISTSIDFTLDNSIDTPTVVLTHDTGSSNSDHITQDGSLIVSAAAADVTRVYTVDGGTAATSYTAPIGDGAHTVVVTDTDTAGNTISTNIDFTLDNSIDTPTVVLAHDTGSSNSDHITKDASLTVSAAAADVTRVYTVDGTDSAGYVAPIGDGAHTVVVTDTDTAGNTISTSIDFTLDNSIDTPTVVLAHDTGSSNSDHITSDASLTVSAAAADVTRVYTVDGTDSAGYVAPIGDGAHTVVVTDTDTAGNTISTSIDFTLDNSIATPTVVLAHDTGSSNSDHITSDASLTVSAAAADVTRTYAIDGGTAAASYTAPIGDGAHTVVVTDTDTAGNTISTSIDFTLDNSIATPTVVLAHDTGSSNSDHITKDASLTVSAAAADVTRTYAIDGGSAAASYTAPTADGAHTVVVTDTDTAGNTISTSIDFTLDNSIDTPTVVLAHDTGSSNSDHITSDASLTVSAAAADVTRVYTVDGTDSAGYTAPTADGAHTVVVTDTDTAGNIATANISFTLQDAVATPTVALTHDTGSSNSDHITQDGSLTVSAVAADVTRVYTVDGTDSATYITPTADGAHTVVVTDTNTAGSSATASISFTLDNSIDTPTVTLTHDTGGSNSDHITSDASLTVSAAAADVTRTYAIDGGTAAASYTAPIGDGAHTVVVTDTDTAGNTISTSIDFTLDNSIDTPTVVLAHDTGSSNSDHITSDASLTVSAAAADVTRTYAIDGGAASASYVAPTADGAHAVVVTDTNTSGSTATSSISFTLDTTIATPTVVLAHDTGGSNSDHITSNAGLTVSAAAADVARTYAIDGGAASASYTAPTANGAHAVVVTDTDTAGNIATASISFTLDTTIATPTVALTNDTGSSNSDHITSNAGLTVSAAAADVIRTYAIDGGAASASYVAPTANGAHAVVVTDTDTAGNIATASIGFTLDTTADSAPTATLDITPATINAAGKNSVAYTIAGVDSDATASVTFTSSGGGSVTVNTLGNGPHTVDLTPLSDGTVTASMALTDIAGNSATGVGDTASLTTSSGGINQSGTSGPDVMTGTPFNDTLNGLAGADTLIGNGGDDNLLGGAGNDTFMYKVGDGADTMNGGAGTDSLYVTGTAGDDTIHVRASGNTLTGLEGGTLAAIERVYLDLGAGNADALSYAGTTSNVTVNLLQSNATGFISIAGVENVTGGSGKDTLTGDTHDNMLDGGAGNDTITGGGGNDVIFGGAGNDTIFYKVGDGADTIDGGAGTDMLEITGTSGSDVINVVVTGSTITGLAGGTVTNVEKVELNLLGNSNDMLSFVGTTSNITVNLANETGTGFSWISGVEHVTGGSGNDTLTGSSVANQLIGGDGNDKINGGGGADILTGGNGSDTFVYTTLSNSRVAAFDTINDFTTGVDKFQIGHALNGLTTGLVKTTGITGDLATDIASILNNTNLKANGAAEITIATGNDAGTYVIINDGSAGYKAGQDAVIKLAGAPLLHTTDFIV